MYYCTLLYYFVIVLLYTTVLYTILRKLESKYGSQKTNFEILAFILRSNLLIGEMNRFCILHSVNKELARSVNKELTRSNISNAHTFV